VLVYKTAAAALGSDPGLRRPIEYQAGVGSGEIATPRGVVWWVFAKIRSSLQPDSISGWLSAVWLPCTGSHSPTGAVCI
jgi:hypothetical protein